MSEFDGPTDEDVDFFAERYLAVLAERDALASELAAARANVADLRLKLNAAFCNVTWPSGQHTVPHVCVEPEHHLTRHRCTCGVKG